MPRFQWPKILPPLTPEQQEVSDDFMHHWHEILPRRHQMLNRFRHSYAAASVPLPPGCRTLEIGAGLGEHILFEDLSRQEYHCLDIRANMIETLKERFPAIHAQPGDCQQVTPYKDGYFSRIIALHILEHLPNLPAAIDEMHRLLADDGFINIVIPCDPGCLYRLARKVSTERLFRKRYQQDYHWFIAREHLNSPAEIISELNRKFIVSGYRYFPFLVPSANANLALGMVARKR
jgi:SAM-dependent methyltransferase